jgi:hypothetical protein
MFLLIVFFYRSLKKQKFIIPFRKFVLYSKEKEWICILLDITFLADHLYFTHNYSRWNMLIASRILNHGEDFSGFLNKNTAKYAGQLTSGFSKIKQYK